MGSNSIVIKCSGISETNERKLKGIFNGANTEYFFNSNCFNKNDCVEISLEVSSIFQEDVDLVPPLYLFVASHCGFGPVLRIHYSSDGQAFFLVCEEGELVWKDLGSTALEGYVIHFTGEGSWLEEDDLERAGGRVSETFNSEVNLLEFGEGGDESLLSKASAAFVRVVSPNELESMHEGWGRVTQVGKVPCISEDDQSEINEIQTAEHLAEWFASYDGRFD